MDHASTSRAIGNTRDSASSASFGIRSYHSTNFVAEWTIGKASIPSFTLDGKPQVFAPPMLRRTANMKNRMERHRVY
ncbi:hypothetical protein TNCV_2799321 [Trichonephila clavipes]|nr:hypothetical protein TNCV_2799321 [Trichonephila clavipes]